MPRSSPARSTRTHTAWPLRSTAIVACLSTLLLLDVVKVILLSLRQGICAVASSATSAHCTSLGSRVATSEQPAIACLSMNCIPISAADRRMLASTSMIPSANSLMRSEIFVMCSILSTTPSSTSMACSSTTSAMVMLCRRPSSRYRSLLARTRYAGLAALPNCAGPAALPRCASQLP